MINICSKIANLVQFSCGKPLNYFHLFSFQMIENEDRFPIPQFYYIIDHAHVLIILMLNLMFLYVLYPFVFPYQSSWNKSYFIFSQPSMPYRCAFFCYVLTNHHKYLHLFNYILTDISFTILIFNRSQQICSHFDRPNIHPHCCRVMIKPNYTPISRHYTKHCGARSCSLYLVLNPTNTKKNSCFF